MKTAISLKVILILVFLCSCRSGDGRFDVSLQQAETAISTSPRDAMAMLDSINPDELSESRRHYYDLLTIMARDKAYITHTSDSLILDVVDYYSSRKSDPLYPKALYLGGRVYSDLGDYPTALNYFHDALEVLPEDEAENLNFKGAVLSQTGRLLHNIRLYTQAIKAIEESIEIDNLMEDTFSMVYDHDMLCHLYINMNNIPKASFHNSESMRLVQSWSSSAKADMETQRALIFQKKGEIDSALQVIRPLPSIVDSICRNYTFGVAARIYMAAGIQDTAYMYASRLVRSDSPNDKMLGYKILTSAELRDVVPADSMRPFVDAYRASMENYLGTHDAQAALIQNANYNYRLHIREREKSEKSKLFTERILIGVCFVTLLSLAILYYVKNKSAREILRLQKMLDILDNSENGSMVSKSAPYQVNDDLKTIKEKLLEKYRDFEKNDVPMPPVPELILKSQPYAEILNSLKKNKGISSSVLWDEIAQVVESASPGFLNRLQILVEGKLTESNLHVVLLIKCGFTPSEMCILLSKTKGTISSNRGYLGKKLFDKPISVIAVDRIIRSL